MWRRNDTDFSSITVSTVISKGQAKAQAHIHTQISSLQAQVLINMYKSSGKKRQIALMARYRNLFISVTSTCTEKRAQCF